VLTAFLHVLLWILHNDDCSINTSHVRLKCEY